MKRLALLGGVLALPGMALAEGFAVTDFTELDVDSAAFTSGEFEALPEARRLMIACLSCDRTAVVDLRLNSARDEVETQVRTGEVTIADMQAACAETSGAITCLGVESADIGAAVGWVSLTQTGENRQLRTYDLYLDGQHLRVQAIAETREEADQLGQTAFEMLAPQIVGR